MFSANAANKKQIPNPVVRTIIGAWRFVFFLAANLTTRYPIMTVRMKKREICRRSIRELPTPNTRAKNTMARTSLTTSAVRSVNPIRDDNKSMSERTLIAMVVDVAKKIVPIAMLCIRDR
ncbi:Uncharacterised protein [uncultured archaeon]|nr:Uncharacterised protein [uncultured archaeon]